MFLETHSLGHITKIIQSLLGRLRYILLPHKLGRLEEEPELKLMISEKPWLLSNGLETQKQQPGNTESKQS